VFAKALVVALIVTTIACDEGSTEPQLPGGASLAELQRTVDSLVAFRGIPGAVVGVQVAGGEQFVIASGVADLAARTPMNPSNRFRIGGVTKTMIATVALQLVDEGRLALDDTIARWLPMLPPILASANRTTLRQLLSHTSGIPDYTAHPAFDSTLAANPGRVWQATDAIALAARSAPSFEPGAPNKWEYSNTNYVVLGLLLETVAGEPVGLQLQRRIFDRIGMTSTYFATTTASPTPFSRGYVDAAGMSDVDVTDRVSPTAAGAAGAVVSNLHDLMLWSPALSAGTLLSPAMRREMSTVFPASGGVGYALGVESFAQWIGHSGEMPGYESIMFTRPGVGTIIVLTNKSTPGGQVAAAIFDDVRWREFGTR
jgi:D-alanyl-D-alanine carboxypeptidase